MQPRLIWRQRSYWLRFPSPDGEEVSATCRKDGGSAESGGRFPSPDGEEVSATRIIQAEAEAKASWKFPSPDGEEVSATVHSWAALACPPAFPSPDGEEVSATF